MPKWPAWRAVPASRSACAVVVSLAVTTCAHIRPATLNAFEAEVTAKPRSRAASLASRNGVKPAPGRVSGAWISSASTQAPWRAADSASAASCSGAGIVPVGLCGLQSTIARAPAAKARSIPSTSSSRPPAIGTSTTLRPRSATSGKKG